MSHSDAYKFGIQAEDEVVAFLERHCLSILHRRYKIAGGEVDIIAKNEETIFFIEVKARKKILEYDNVLKNEQLSRICIVAEDYISKNQIYKDLNVRFDLFIIQKTPRKFLHFKNITL